MLLPLLVAQGQSLFHAPDDSLVVSGVETWSKFAWNRVKGTLAVAGTGQPIKILVNTMGMTMVARSADVSAQRADAKTWFVTKAHFEKAARVVIDSADAAAYAAKLGKPAPKNRSQQMHLSVSTEVVDYVGSQTRGEMTFPGPFDASGHSAGKRIALENSKKVAYNYSETFAMRGASAKLTVDPEQGAGIRTIQSGHFQGPIEFTAERLETNELTKAVSTVRLENGQSDEAEISTDADGETVILKGHVHFDLVGEQGAMHFRDGDAVTIRLGPDLDLQSVEGLGSPVVTTVPIRPTKK